MRRAALGLLAAQALGGCNQIFGLEGTDLRADAFEVKTDATWAGFDLGYLQLSFDPVASVPPPVLVPMPDLASVKVGTADGPLVDATPGDAGHYFVPIEITNAGPFRLVYQRSSDPVPHEYQGLVDGARVIEPLFGPVTRPPVTVNAGFEITAASGGMHPVNRVYTTGTWTEGTGIGSFNKVNYAFEASNTVSMSGPLGLPAATDAGLLVDYSGSLCGGASGSSKFSVVGVMAHAPVTGDAWDASMATPRTITHPPGTDFPGGINPFSDGTIPRYSVKLGYIPSPAMPAFTRPGQDSLGSTALLPNPVMVPLRACASLTSTGNVHLPRLLQDRLTEAYYSEVSSTRTTGGATVTNGIAFLTLNELASESITLKPRIPIAQGVMLQSGSTMTELFTGDDQPVKALPAATGVRTLSWTWNKALPSTDDPLVDYWEVALVELAGGPLPRKTYTVAHTNATTASVVIGANDTMPGKKYVFRISAFLGRPDAKTGNFARVTGAQQMSIVHTHAFVAP